MPKKPKTPSQHGDEYRITVLGEIVAHKPDEKSAVTAAKKAAKDAGSTAYIEEWRPTRSFNKEGKPNE